MCAPNILICLCYEYSGTTGPPAAESCAHHVCGRCLTGVDVLYSKPSLNPILPNTIECDHDSPSPALSPLPRDRYCPSWPDSAITIIGTESRSKQSGTSQLDV